MATYRPDRAAMNFGLRAATGRETADECPCSTVWFKAIAGIMRDALHHFLGITAVERVHHDHGDKAGGLLSDAAPDAGVGGTARHQC